MYLRSMHDHCGFYIGQDGFLTVTPGFIAVMLRLAEEHIVSALLADGQVVAVVDGYGHTSAALLQQQGKAQLARPADSLAQLDALAQQFTQCEADFVPEGACIHFDARAFPLALAAPISAGALCSPSPIDESLSIAARMQRWNRGIFYGWTGDAACRAWVSDGRYDMNWAIDMASCFIYCRLGVSGYCDQGWAMRSTAVLRAHEVRMLADHRDAMLPYHPDERCFVPDGCAFPADGGWYWSVREATQDQITLNGCGGDIYAIYRPR